MHNHVNVVKINDIGADRTSGLVEEFFKIARILHDPPWRFGCHINPVAPAAFQSLPGDGFALSAKIDPSGINVIHSALNRTMNHGNAQIGVHCFPIGKHRQTQKPESQSGNIHSGPSHRTIAHLLLKVQNRSGRLLRRIFRRLQHTPFPQDSSGSGHQCRGFQKLTSIHFRLLPLFPISIRSDMPDYDAPSDRYPSEESRHSATPGCMCAFPQSDSDFPADRDPSK